MRSSSACRQRIAYNKGLEGLVGLLRPSEHGTVSNSNAVNNLGGVLWLDLVLGADSHQIGSLRVVDGVHVGLLPDAAIDSSLLGNDLTEGVLPVAATATRFARRSGGGVDLFA